MDVINPIQKDNEQAFWIDAIRAIAMFVLILHNWCSVFFQTNDSGFGGNVLNMFLPFSGSFIQLFFIISGSGLVIWFYRNPKPSWNHFFKRRLLKIIVPYWITASLFFVLINYSNRVFPDFFLKNFDLNTLLKYLLFIQNQYPEIWNFNRSYWFLPVIIQLYFLFPFILYLQRKTSLPVFVLAASTITIASIFLWEMCGYRLSNLSAIFPFFIAQFALGMGIGKLYLFNRRCFDKTYTASGFMVGILLYFLAFLFTKYIPSGHYVSDIFSALGLFLTVNYIVRFVAEKEIIVSVIRKYSAKTYLLYLLHLFIIVYFLKPFLSGHWNIKLGNHTLFIMGAGYNVILFFMIDWLTKYQKRLSSRLRIH